MSAPTFPDVVVQLTGTDGNAYAILGRVRSALADAGVGPEAVAEFMAAATAGDYDELLRVVTATVDVR